MKGSDRSGWYWSLSRTVAVLVATVVLAIAPYGARAACTGDCNTSGTVTVDEILTMVNIALGTEDITSCEAGDANMNHQITVDEILAAIKFALTACPITMGVCGDMHVDTDQGEECDNGGTCIGGSNAGMGCKADTECEGQGVCRDGVNAERACDNNGDCPNSTCVHCKTFGGNGCAANCTNESPVNITLVQGQTPDVTVLASGSGIAVHGDGGFNYAIAFPAGVTRQLLVGKEKDGKIPGTLKSETNQTPAIDVLGGTACICLRPIVYMTCGGTLWEKDGTPSTDCSAGYTAGSSVCTNGKPCALVYGPDNIGEGEVGCGAAGLDGVNTLVSQVSTGLSGSPAGPVLTTLSGNGGAGSAVLFVTTELGFTLNACSVSPGQSQDVYGPDGKFCSSDDPFTSPDPATTGRNVLPQVLTTGIASGTLTNVKDTGDTIGACQGGGNAGLGCSTDADCPDSTCVPVSSTGVPLASCSALAGGSLSGITLADAFPSLNSPTIGDIVVIVPQVAQ